MILKNLEANTNTIVTENNLDFHIINSQAELRLESLVHCDAIIFRTEYISFLKTEIRRIRRSDNPALYLKPIFVSSKRTFLRLEKNVDGYIGDGELVIVHDKVSSIVTRIMEINLFSFPKQATFQQKNFIKLSQYLLTRDKALKPQRSRKSHMGYQYNFINYLVSDLEMATFLDSVNEMKKKGFVTTKLVERVNLCKSCSGSYLHFEEVCHKCKSNDIDSEYLIHHFRCAYIGPESDFKRGDSLVCPKCDKELRHIGVDYDKPSEIINCNSCDHQSQQSAILANCVDCDTKNELAHLHSKSVFSIKLTDQGENLALNPHSLFGEYAEEKEETLELELEPATFSLLANQESKKKYTKGLASYTVDLSFSDVVLANLVPSEKKTFMMEFKKILINYLEDIDLFTATNAQQYKMLLISKSRQYIEDMKQTLEYNINKILNDNFNDPDHRLEVNANKL